MYREGSGPASRAQQLNYSTLTSLLFLYLFSVASLCIDINKVKWIIRPSARLRTKDLLEGKALSAHFHMSRETFMISSCRSSWQWIQIIRALYTNYSYMWSYLVQNNNFICIHDGWQPVGNENRCSVSYHFFHGAQDVLESNEKKKKTQSISKDSTEFPPAPSVCFNQSVPVHLQYLATTWLTGFIWGTPYDMTHVWGESS